MGFPQRRTSQKPLAATVSVTYGSGDIAATGTGTATWVGRSFAAGTLSSAGTGTATWVGRSTKAAVFSSSGAATAAWVAAGTQAAVLAAAGTGTATFIGRSFVSRVLSSVGVGTATWVGVGIQTKSSVLASAGVAAAAFVGSTTAATTTQTPRPSRHRLGYTVSDYHSFLFAIGGEMIRRVLFVLTLLLCLTLPGSAQTPSGAVGAGYDIQATVAQAGVWQPILYVNGTRFAVTPWTCAPQVGNPGAASCTFLLPDITSAVHSCPGAGTLTCSQVFELALRDTVFGEGPKSSPLVLAKPGAPINFRML